MWEEEGSVGLSSPGCPKDFQLGAAGSGLPPYCPVASDLNSCNIEIHHFKVNSSVALSTECCASNPTIQFQNIFISPKGQPVPAGRRSPSPRPRPRPHSLLPASVHLPALDVLYKQKRVTRGLLHLNLSLSIMFAAAFYF